MASQLAWMEGFVGRENVVTEQHDAPLHGWSTSLAPGPVYWLGYFAGSVRDTSLDWLWKLLWLVLGRFHGLHFAL